LEVDCFEKGQDTEALVAALCQQHPADLTLGGEPHLRDLHIAGNGRRCLA
jgi:hypothetical protein